MRELVVGIAGLGEINVLDPARAVTTAPLIVVWQLYDRMVAIRPDGTVGPGLASDWQSSADLKEWRFRIRKDAYFHATPSAPARPVTPQDVRASIERALRIPGYAQTLLGDLVLGAQDFVHSEAASLQGVEIVGDEVVFRLVQPFAFLPERLAVSFYSIVPDGTPIDVAEPPVGSGPYRLVEWDRVKQKVVLEKAEHAWMPPTASSPERLTVHVFASEGTAIEELFAGTLDWLETTAAALPILQPSAKARGLRIETPPQTDMRFIALNFRHPKFAENPGIGAALNYATDREAIIRVLGGGRAVGGPVLGVTGFEFDAERARALIAEIPPEARTLELLVQPGQQSRMMAELLKDQWAAVGLNVTLRSGLADFVDRVVKGNYEMALGYYGPFVPSPEQYLWPYRAKARPIPNVMGFSSDAFEQAYNAYISARSEGVREENLLRAIEAVTERPPAVWLVQVPNVVATRTRLTAPRIGAIPLFDRLRPVR